MADKVEDPKPEAEEKDAKEGKEPTQDNLRGELERRKDAQRKAERELQDMREKILEFEDRDKSELQRANDRATRAEMQLQELSGKITSLEKGAWVRSAAAEFNFHDPEDAAVILKDQLGDFEDPREARRAVERLAKTKQHLTRQDKKQENRPSIGQVLANGEQKQQLTPAQAAATTQAQREIEFAQGLAGELDKFRSTWTSFGGS